MTNRDFVESLASCPLCGTIECSSVPVPEIKIGTEFFGDKIQMFGLSRCLACGLEFVNPRPSRDLLVKYYDTLGYPAHNAAERIITARSTNEFRLSMVSKLAHSGSKCLDYGCGSGCFAKMANEKGWQVIGVEPSIVGRKSSADLGVEVYERMEDLPANNLFDVVTMFHILEHVPNPVAVLSSVKNVMSDNSLLIVEVPNIRSLRAMTVNFLKIWQSSDERYRSFPIHLFGFNRKTLVQLLLKSGFFISKITTFYVGGMTSKLGHSNSVKDCAVIDCTDEKVISGSRFSLINLLKKIFFTLCLGENLVVVARPVNKVDTVNI